MGAAALQSCQHPHPCQWLRREGLLILTWPDSKARPAPASPHITSWLEGDAASLGAQRYLGAVRTDVATKLKARVLQGPLFHTVLQVMHTCIQISSACQT